MAPSIPGTQRQTAWHGRAGINRDQEAAVDIGKRMKICSAGILPERVWICILGTSLYPRGDLKLFVHPSDPQRKRLHLRAQIDEGLITGAGRRYPQQIQSKWARQRS